MNRDPRSFFPNARFGEVHEVLPITQGLSGAGVYAVTTDNGEFVLKLQVGDREKWTRTIALQRVAAEHGIAPELVAVDEEHAASISVKVAGVPFGMAVSRATDPSPLFGSLVSALAKLHSLPLPPHVDTSDETLETARTTWKSQINRPGFPEWVARLEGRLHEGCALLEADPRRVFSHNDVNPVNVFWDGARVWLLDWERAREAHPYLDLASMADFTLLPDDTALALLSAQERTTLDAEARRAFLLLRDFCRIVYGAVFLRLVPDLERVELPAREETPELGECYRRIASGALQPGTPQGQALLGAALLKQVVL